MLDGVVARAAARGRALAPHPTPLAKLMTPMINLDRPIKADRIQTVPISYLFLQRVLASRIAMLLLTIDRTQEQPLPFFPLRISYLRILTYSTVEIGSLFVRFTSSKIWEGSLVK